MEAMLTASLCARSSPRARTLLVPPARLPLGCRLLAGAPDAGPFSRPEA